MHRTNFTALKSTLKSLTITLRVIRVCKYLYPYLLDLIDFIANFTGFYFLLENYGKDNQSTTLFRI
ncbi:hypothetical protein [Halobacteriovorax marinus]|uniref:hypothetical protein n=1 Tax=Halobacteriovorax marinus TaxID=97084 RepID=UPI003A8DA327